MALQTVTFNYTGSSQTWTVPRHVPGTLTVRIVGGAGGTGGPQGGSNGGPGGGAIGTLTLAAGTTLTVDVGGVGTQYQVSPSNGPAPGGWPDGGDGWGRGGAGGGGASRLLTGSTLIAAAGAGGGGGFWSSATSGTTGGAGGDGAGTGIGGNGANGTSFPTAGSAGGGGGTLSAAGAGGARATSAPTAGNGTAGSGGAGGDGGAGSASNFRGGGGGGGGGYYGGGGGGGGASFNQGAGGGGSTWVDSSYVTVTGSDLSTGTGLVIFEWEPLTTIDRCEELIFTPGTVVPQGSDGAVVYSSGALDSFGTDETPVDWPTTGAKIKAIEVELTSTTPGFTQNGQVQVAVTRPDGLSPLPGATSDASASYSGASGFVNTYRTSLADCFYLSKFGGWLTDYTSPTASIGTSNTLQLGIIPAFGQDWDIRFEVRRASWSTSTANTVSGTGTTPLIRCDAAGLYVALDPWYFPYATTVPWATLGAVNGDWLTVRVTFDLTNRLRVWIPSGGGWTLVQSAALTGYTETATKWGAWYARLGNGQNASGIGQIGLDGDLRSYVIRDPSTIIMDLGLDRMPTSTSYSWATTGGTASWFGLSPIPPRVTGSTVPATVRVRADLETPCLAEDLRLIVDAQTGALTVDEILLEAECGGGIYRDGRVHLS